MGKNELRVIVGLGITGLACVDYFVKRGIPVAVTDSRPEPPGLAELQKSFPQIPFAVGGFDIALLSQAVELVVSPGVSINEPSIAAQLARGVSVVGDIELFAREVTTPVSAITGSNGKTTVTTLLGLMVEEAGLGAAVCGNIGRPVLSLLDQGNHDFYVMELSSFQLETTYSLASVAAVLLNVSPDHMDRYATYDDYCHAKQRIYQHCQHPVVNADQPEIWQDLTFNQKPITFSLEQNSADFSLGEYKGEWCLFEQGQLLIPIDELKLRQRHHLQNALASLAMGRVMGLPMESMLATLRQFTGLAHRCQWVGEFKGIVWYNDSKATNVGAALAAIISIGSQKKSRLLLIAGGDAKCADLSPLYQSVVDFVDHLVLMGQDAPAFQNLFSGKVPITLVNSMDEAVAFSANWAKAKDIILLSPACASLDMFRNYEHRGEVFIEAIKKQYSC